MKNRMCKEEDVEVVERGDNLIFPGVDSCTAITVVMSNGALVGGHLVMDRPNNDFTEEALFSNMHYILRVMERTAGYMGKKVKPKRIFFIGSTLGHYPKDDLEPIVQNLFNLVGRSIFINATVNPIDIYFFTERRRVEIRHKGEPVGGAGWDYETMEVKTYDV